MQPHEGPGEGPSERERKRERAHTVRLIGIAGILMVALLIVLGARLL